MKWCSIEFCEEPARHSLLRNDGTWKHFCAVHYDKVLDKLREYDFEGIKQKALAKFRKGNPGVL